jgi:hypothetical protein
MASSNANLTVFSREKPVFIREYGAGYYSVGAYFFAKVYVFEISIVSHNVVLISHPHSLAELPLYIIVPCFQSLVIIYAVGLQRRYVSSVGVSEN